MFSLELPDNIIEIEDGALAYCFWLRNVAFSPNAVLFGDHIFIETLMGMTIISDLHPMFGSEAEIISGLQHRCDRLPIQRLYYQSYNQGVLQILVARINMRSGDHNNFGTCIVEDED